MGILRLTTCVVADLFRAHATELVRMARLFVDDRNAAEDLVQEAFIRLAGQLDRIRDEPSARSPTSARSCSTSPATTTAGASCRCATSRRATTST